tara:strand:- start:796 stop:1167 length:372 start_codon:yes stop_codon:yes gene_type:complete
MLFFSLVVAPTINGNLTGEERSLILRKIFPKNFLFGLSISFVGFLLALNEKQSVGIVFFAFISIFFLINLYVLVPKINKVSGNLRKSNNGNKNSKIFKKLHFFSVLLYLIQMIISLTGIYLFF